MMKKKERQEEEVDNREEEWEEREDEAMECLWLQYKKCMNRSCVSWHYNYKLFVKCIERTYLLMWGRLSFLFVWLFKSFGPL